MKSLFLFITSEFPFGIVINPFSNDNVHFEVVFALVKNAEHQVFISSLTVLNSTLKSDFGWN